MNLFKWADKSIKRFNWWDMSVLKMDVVFFTLFLIAVWPAFRSLVLGIGWIWYLAISIVLMIPLLKKMFS
jgi:hypothetical protein